MDEKDATNRGPYVPNKKDMRIIERATKKALESEGVSPKSLRHFTLTHLVPILVAHCYARKRRPHKAELQAEAAGLIHETMERERANDRAIAHDCDGSQRDPDDTVH